MTRTCLPSGDRVAIILSMSNALPTQNITTVRKGKRIGVNVDGKAVGWATRTNLAKQPEHWTATVYIDDPPFDTQRLGFTNADDVVAFIARNGTPRA
jgi:hypothetical protein